MNLKRYRAETVQEALRAVREDLGPDAFVLSTRVVPVRGLKGWFGGRLIEITAAADRPLVSDDRHLEARARAGRPTRRPEAERASDSIVARLQAAGLDPGFAREVADAHPREQRRAATSTSLKQTIADTLSPLATGDEAYAPVEVFLGPPGAGKTTTIAKIAAQERAKVRGKRLGLISADGFRVGAVEQLRIYADILGAPLDVARTPMELEMALDKAKRPLLLDTAGRSASDEASRDMLRVLASRRDVRAHLVLAAGTPGEQVKRIFDRFEEARPSRIVITKLDEAESLAPLVPVLRDRGLPLSYLGTGQSVPEDLERATAPAIAAWVSGEGLRRSTGARGVLSEIEGRKGARIPCA